LVNVKQELYNFSAININEIVESNPLISDNEKNSFMLYNKALESLKNDSEDMAIIELKKALSMNPDFPEALNVLGLCYIYMKDYVKASSAFEKVILMEKSGVKASKYFNAITSGESSNSAISGKKKTGSIKIDSKSSNISGTSFVNDIINIKGSWKRDIFKYLIGFIVGALILFALQITFLKGNTATKDVSTDIQTTNKIVNAAVDKDEASYKTKYKSLNKDYEKLKIDLKTSNDEINYLQNVKKLSDVESLVSKNNYEPAADLLILLKPVTFKGADKQKFDSMYNKTISNAQWYVLDEGISLFSTYKYQDAIQKLNKISIYNDKWESSDRAYYYIGKSYMALNDTKNAISIFQKIISTYPNSKYTGYSRNYLTQLTLKP